MKEKSETEGRDLSKSIEELVEVNRQLIRLLATTMLPTPSLSGGVSFLRWQQPTIEDLLEFFRLGGGTESVENWKKRIVGRQRISCELTCQLEELRAREEIFRCRLDAASHGFPSENCDELEAAAAEQVESCRQACRNRIRLLEKRLKLT